MARRVNTRFLVTVTLVLAGGLVTLFAAPYFMKERNGDVYAKQAEAYEKQGKLPQALEYWAKANEHESNVSYRLKMGDLLKDAPREMIAVYGPCYQQWEKALEYDPANPATIDRLMKAYVEMGEVRP